MVNAVSRENLIANIQALQAFGNRYEYNPQQEAAADWMINQLNWWGGNAQSDPYRIGTTALLAVDMVSKDSGWVVGSAGTCLSTADGGHSWTKILNPLSRTSTTARCIDFLSSRIGWIAGDLGAIASTTDGGATWSDRSTGNPAPIMDIGFRDAQTGIAVGGGGQIFRTSNAGLTWSLATLGRTVTLRRLKLLDQSTNWVVGDSGVIIHSTNGGATWTTRASNTNAILYGIDFPNVQTGWAVGSGSTVLQSTNGGTTWTKRTDVAVSFPGRTFYDVCFSDSLSGWISASGGSILKTSDGGRTWSISNACGRYGSTPALYRISRVSGRYLLASGSSSMVVASQDGGATWSSLWSSLPADLFHSSRNVIVTIPGQVTPLKECLMIAHYDGVSAGPGADDNASGTSAVMEAARILGGYQFESTIRLIAVSGEEVGLCGSSDYASRARGQNSDLLGVVNADMIGYPLTGDTARLIAGSYYTHCRLADSVVVFNKRYGIGAKVDLSDSSSGSDHVPFTSAGYDAIIISEGSSGEIWARKNPFYHTPNDSLSKLHPGLIRRSAQLMIASVAELARPIGLTAVPTECLLEQNYPNPFNAGTVISFTLPQATAVKLRVCDVLGRLVATLYDGTAGPGVHRFTWTAKGVSSGVYFYSLHTDRFTDVKKMVLVK